MTQGEKYVNLCYTAPTYLSVRQSPGFFKCKRYEENQTNQGKHR